MRGAARRRPGARPPQRRRARQCGRERQNLHTRARGARGNRPVVHEERGMTTTTETTNGTDLENPLHRLTEEQIEELGRKLDELHDQVKSDLGERDSRYIRGIIDLQRRLALLGRVLLIPSWFPPAWIAGTTTLSMAKI